MNVLWQLKNKFVLILVSGKSKSGYIFIYFKFSIPISYWRAKHL